jgi:hypothetical protein
MAAINQIEANRRNALKSTGPKTPEGKAAVRMNSLRHGLRARTVVLPGENRDEFNQLCDDLEREWEPQSRTAQFYLEQMAVSQWKLTRMEVAEAGIFKESLSAKTQLPLLDRLWQAQGRLERSYARAQRELERLQPYRPIRFDKQKKEPAPQPAPQPADEVPSVAASPAASKPQPTRRAPVVMSTPPADAAPPSVEAPSRVESARGQ